MYNYVNKINVGINPDKTEVLLSFVQETPQFHGIQKDSDGNLALQTNNVADIVVTGEFAKEIARLILSIVGE